MKEASSNPFAVKKSASIFMIFLIVTMSISSAYALSITFNPATDVTRGDVFATINWTTDEPSDSIVVYGNSTANVNTQIQDANYVLQHSLNLTNLIPNTTYYYKIISNTATNRSELNNSDNYYQFQTLQDATPPFINATIPAFHNSGRLNIEGLTEPYALIHAYANPAPGRVGLVQYDREAFADANGRFVIAGLILDTAREINEVVIWARDRAGNTNTISGQLRLDTEPPELKITIPNATTTSMLRINGTVNELVAMNFYVQPIFDDKTPPAKPSNLVATPFQSYVTLNWDANTEDDFKEYIVYRDDIGAIAIVQSPSYIDNFVNSGRTYTYSVSAVDRAGNEGDKADAVAQIPAGNIAQPLPQQIDLTKRFLVKSVNISGAFSEEIPLQEYKNKVIVEAIDKGGNIADAENSVLFDTKPPSFIRPTSIEAEYSPSYTADITINGQIDEPATLNVYVNGVKQATVRTGENNTFSADIELKRDFSLKANLSDSKWLQVVQALNTTTNRTIDVWPNHIIIEAIDDAGQGTNLTGIIEYTLCGSGTWWNVKRTDSTPDTLIPRLLLDGNAMLAFNFELEWQGPGAEPRLGAVNVQPAPISAEKRKLYDYDWISSISPTTREKRGYVVINLKAPDPTPPGENWTYSQKEENISKHRLTEKLPKGLEQEYCKLPGVGCVKLFLLMEIPFYSEKIAEEIYPIEPYAREQVQKHCWDIEIPIDRQIPVAKLSGFLKSFLNASVQFLNNTIELIDLIYKPALQIRNYAFFGCIGMMAVQFFIKFKEFLSCEFSDWAKLTGKGFPRDIAEQGEKVCDDQANDGWNPEQINGCKQCAKAIEATRKFEEKRNWVCDRTFSPAAPSLQKYIKENELNKKSYCSGLEEKQAIEIWKDAKKITDADKDCPILHKYADAKTNPQQNHIGCCGIEYKRKWNSACSFMDELRESACLQDQSNRAVGAQGAGESELTCYPIWNAAAGFCSPQGTATPELVNGRDFSPGKMPKISDDNLVYFRIRPKSLTGEGKPENFEIHMGYIAKSKRIVALKTPELEERSRVSEELEFVPLEDITNTISTQVKCDDCDAISAITPECQKVKDFKTKYREATGSDTDACAVYTQIQNKIGAAVSDQIVDPTAGVLRSFQCISMPAIVTHLEIYRNALIAIKNCFETIMLTGEGKTGQCQAVISYYVCDLMLDAISCFARRYSVNAGAQLREGLGIGNVVGALASAGSGVADSLRERYGATTIWRTLFVEKRLTHAICLSAFTGEWISNFENLLNTALAVPVNSTSFVFPAERRFVAADFLSKSATWIYRIGVGFVAGANMDSLSLYLICSDDATKCSDIEDFKNGRCDCTGKGKKERLIKGWGRINQGTVIGEGGQGEEIVYQLRDRIRYDRAELRWTYTDAQGQTVTASSGEIPIRLVGSPAPAYCEFDESELEFRCDIGVGAPEDTIRFVSIKPTKDFYYPGDYITLDYEISQRVPKDAEELCAGSLNCKYTKYLNIVIRDAQTKARIWPAPDKPIYRIPLPVGTETHRFSEPTDAQITETMFKTRTAKWKSKVITGVPLLNVAADVTGVTASTAFIIKINNSQIQRCDLTIPTGQTLDTYTPTTIDACEDIQANADNVWVTIDGARINILKGENGQAVAVQIIVESLAEACEDTTWEVVSSLTESVSRQRPGVAQYTATDQVVYYGDQPQEKVTPIKIRCQRVVEAQEYEISPQIEVSNNILDKIIITIKKATRKINKVNVIIDGTTYSEDVSDNKATVTIESSLQLEDDKKEYPISIQLFDENDALVFRDDTYKIKKNDANDRWKLFQTIGGEEKEVSTKQK